MCNFISIVYKISSDFAKPNAISKYGKKEETNNYLYRVRILHWSKYANNQIKYKKSKTFLVDSNSSMARATLQKAEDAKSKE